MRVSYLKLSLVLNNLTLSLCSYVPTSLFLIMDDLDMLERERNRERDFFSIDGTS